MPDINDRLFMVFSLDCLFLSWKVTTARSTKTDRVSGQPRWANQLRFSPFLFADASMIGRFRLREKSESASNLSILRAFKVPDENKCIAEKQKQCLYPSIPSHHEGRYGQSSRNVRRGAMDALAGVRRMRAEADGEGVWSWPPDAEVKRSRDVSRARRWLKSPAHRGEREISRKPSRREMLEAEIPVKSTE